MVKNFIITSEEKISIMFLGNNVSDFREAIHFIKQIPYGRNANKDDLSTVFTDGCGTCSTKHALLKQLAIENQFDSVQLVIGLFKMNAENTSGISKTLQQHKLAYIPEAHCYLKIENEIIDATKVNFRPENYVNDLIDEIEILPNQINQFKINYHQNYLKKWLKENPDIDFSFDYIWSIREKCIEDLSKK